MARVVSRRTFLKLSGATAAAIGLAIAAEQVSYLSPRGLITLKTLAALQRDAARDTLDLIALAPTETNMQEALDWCLSTTVDRSAAAPQIATLLTRLNHGNLTQRYQA